MYNSKLTKAEIIDRIVKERERLIYNKQVVKTDFEKSYYQDQIEYLKILFKLLEIENDSPN